LSVEIVFLLFSLFFFIILHTPSFTLFPYTTLFRSYTKYNMTLLNIFCKIYSYIYIHEHKLSIIDRLYSELIDSVGLCSSGFMARMINTLSGYDDFYLEINYEDIIFTYFKYIVNNLIKESTDCDTILIEMSNGGGDALRKFIGQNL